MPPNEKRVAVVDPDGNFGTLPESEVQQLPEGARVLSRQEEAERAVNERYDALPTWRKVVGGVTAAVSTIGGPLNVGHTIDAPPSIAAYGAGIREGLTGGLADAGTRKLVDATLGKAEGDKYAQQVDDTHDASPIAHGAGTTIGMVGGAALGSEVGAARAALPSAAISAAGGAIESGVERALGGLASKGVLGRATTTAAKMAVRGGFEGAAFSVTDQAAHDITHDTPTTGQKMWAAGMHGGAAGFGLGAILGFSGSLAASGARAGRNSIAEAITSRAARAEEGALAESYAAERPPMLEAGGRPPTEPGAPMPEPAPTVPPVPRASVASGAKAAVSDMAGEQAWKAVGGGFGLQTSRFAKQAAKYFADGTKDLGKIALKYGVIDMGEAAASPWAAAKTAAMSGTPDSIAPKLAAAREQVGKRLGEITDASGARISTADLRKTITRARSGYDRIAGNEHVVHAIDGYEASLLEKLASPDGTVRVQDLLEQRKGLDEIVYTERNALDPGRRVAALRDIRSGMEDLISEAMDNASGRVPGELRAEYHALKKDFHGLSILTEAAEDSAARASKHATFGLGEKFAVAQAVASGHFAAAPILAVGGKLIRERGNAAAAAFLTRASEQGHVDAIIAAWDKRVSAAAKGVLHEAPASASKPKAKQTPQASQAQTEQARADVRETQAKGQAVIKHLGDLRADPSKLMSQVQTAADLVERSAGRRAAESYTAMSLRAITYVASYVPQRERRDPLDPRSVPPLNYDEADRLVRASRYAVKPETILDDFERGIVTPEGLKAADMLLPPEDLEKFRGELRHHVELKVMRGTLLTQSQRLRVDKLLQSPAGADLKPAAIARLQDNLTKKGPSGSSPPAGPTGGGGTPPPSPVDLKVQQTGFDSVEARLAG